MGLRSFIHKLTASPRGNPAYQSQLGTVKLVCVVDQSLKMGKGKIAAQVGHASVKAALQAAEKYPDEMTAWMSSGQQKVVLKAPNTQEIEFALARANEASLPTCTVRDAGRTQIPAGSLTVIAIGPASEVDIDEITGHLKLL